MYTHTKQVHTCIPYYQRYTGVYVVHVYTYKASTFLYPILPEIHRGICSTCIHIQSKYMYIPVSHITRYTQVYDNMYMYKASTYLCPILPDIHRYMTICTCTKQVHTCVPYYQIYTGI